MKSAFVLSVSELNGYVQRLLASDPMLQGIQMRGEISNFKRHSSGHCYFVLKDDQSRIQCVMFRSYAQMTPLRPSDGMRVIVAGHVALYSRDGQYQFYAEAMRPDGIGELYLQFERLKQKLQQEGLFDAAHKRPLPLLPVGVGIVTSPTG
nr:exodeoxyribonuclease VII large subunit [Clostridia bacterium]